MRLRLYALLLGVLALAVPAIGGAQSVPPVVSHSGTVTGTGDSYVVPLNGYSMCSVVTSGGGATYSLTVKGSSDNGSSWNTITSIGSSGVISADGTYTGNVINQASGATTLFKFTLTANTGTVTYTESCSTANGLSGGGTGTNVSVVNTPGVSIQNALLTVNTPAPAPTVSPGLFQGVELICPSTSPLAINGAYLAQCDSSGYVGVNVKNTPGVTIQNTPAVNVSNVTPTAAPGLLGYAAPAFGFPTLAQILCQYNTGVYTFTSPNLYGIQCDSSGNVKTLAAQGGSWTVTANAGTGTFGVSGTVSANQSGTWTVQPGNTANTTSWLAALCNTGAAPTCASVSGANALKVDGSAVTQPVSGTFWQATQPVSGTFWQATQPVSGTVTANQGGAPWTVSHGGTGTAAFEGTSTAAVPSGSATNVVVKASSGRVFGALVTTSGAAELDCYDNATTNSGTKVLVVPANASVGSFWAVNMPLANGITCAETTTTSAVTVSYS